MKIQTITGKLIQACMRGHAYAVRFDCKMLDRKARVLVERARMQLALFNATKRALADAQEAALCAKEEARAAWKDGLDTVDALQPWLKP